jgi:hypothetical protein
VGEVSMVVVVVLAVAAAAAVGRMVAVGRMGVRGLVCACGCQHTRHEGGMLKYARSVWLVCVLCFFG